MGYSDIITRSGYPGVVAAAAAAAAAALTAAAAARMPARPLEQTPEPNAGPEIRHFLPHPVRSTSPEALEKGSIAKLAATAEARRAVDMTPEPGTRPGPIIRIGFSLPLPVRSPTPEAGDAASATEDAFPRRNNPSSSAVTWLALARGETAPPEDRIRNQVHRTGHLLLPISTPEPEGFSENGTGSRLEMHQKITPHFVFSPTSRGGDVRQFST